MRIECRLPRPGGSLIDLDGVTYHFRPDATGRHVAEVERPAHIARLLAISEGYGLIDDSPMADEPAPNDLASGAPEAAPGAADPVPTGARQRARKTQADA